MSLSRKPAKPPKRLRAAHILLLVVGLMAAAYFASLTYILWK